MLTLVRLRHAATVQLLKNLPNVSASLVCSESTLSKEEMQKQKLPKLNLERENRISLLSDVENFKNVVPEYNDLQEMQNAPDVVKKVFSWEFVSYKHKVDNLFLQYYDQLKHYKPDSHEILIIKLTLRLRLLKIRIKDTTKSRKTREGHIVNVANLRNKLLWELRQTNYDRYERIMKVLDMRFTYPPVFDQYKYTRRATSIADMRIRTFAHIKKRKEILEARKEELLKKEKEFEEKIRNNEIGLDHELSVKPPSRI